MIKINKKSTKELFTNKKLDYYQDCYLQIFLVESRWGYKMRIK